MRQRTQSETTPFDGFTNTTITTGTCSNPSAVSSEYETLTSFNAYSRERVMNDVVTPKFQSLIAKGAIINNPYDSLETILTNQPCAYVYDARRSTWTTSCTPDKWLDSGWYVTGTVPSTDICKDANGVVWYASQPSISVQSLIDRAIANAWGKVDMSQAQALCTLGEAEKTIVSMGQILVRLFKIIKAVKKLDVLALKKQISPKELSDRYMELRYAIRPLFYDAKQIVKALNFVEPKTNRLTFRGFTKDTETTAEELHYRKYASASVTYDVTLSGTAQRTVEVRSGVLTKIESISKLNVWGFDQLAETVWELTPFSFIVDWFLNVGEVIAAWTPEMGLKTLASWYVVHDTTYYSTEVVHTALIRPSDTATIKYYGKTFDWTGAKITKTIVSKYRVPDPSRFVLPTFNVNLNALKLLDLAIIGRKIFLRS